MKSKLQVRKNSNIRNSCRQTRLGSSALSPTNGAGSAPPVTQAQPATPKREYTPAELEDLERWRTMRHNKMNSPVDYQPPGIYFPPRSDAQLLDFLSLVVSDHEPALRKIADAAAAKGDRFWAVYLAEAIIAAKAAARRAIYYGLHSAPSAGEEKQNPRDPLLLELRGLSGLTAYDDSQLLSHIGSTLYYFRQEILDRVRAHLAGEAEGRLVEALAIAELVQDRDGGLDEVEEAAEKRTRTVLQAMVWTQKTCQAIIC